jgi:DNA-directed RNA polymerase specialized sigma24 family protein
MCPDEYRSVVALRTIKCQVLMQLVASDQNVLMQDIEAELDPLFPFVLTLIDDNGKEPANGQWAPFIVNVATSVYRLTRPALREKFIVAVHHGLFSATSNVQIEEEDLWSMSFATVLKRIADPTFTAVREPEKFLFTTARNLFLNEIRRSNHERSVMQEAITRSAGHDKRRDWLRGHGIEDLAADLEDELPRFVADKLKQQTRSKRTRAVAEARMKGFAMVFEMLLQHPDRSLDACRIRVERIADRINRNAPTTFTIVPGRSTFFRWTNELVSRIWLRAERRVIFPYSARAVSF